jgi:RNA polymerase sigma-70 factor (ECF subfamily)
MRSAVPIDVFSVLDRSSSNVRALPAADALGDAELVERAKGGDRWAEEAIYRRHVQPLAGLAIRVLRNRAEAEDVVQDTFAIALDQLGSLREGAALRGWLWQIAVSQVRRRLRRRRLLRVIGLDTTVDDAALEALAAETVSGETRAELAQLDRVLAELPIGQRIAWMLRHVEGETLEHVAEACSCSLATAKRWIAAADARVSLHVRLKGGAE